MYNEIRFALGVCFIFPCTSLCSTNCA